jgi:aldehyde dehydrogenase (NAD+)/betaine-aldehyde dehydrogenase
MNKNYKFQLYIDGAFCDATDGATFMSINPATEEPWAVMPAAGEADVDHAVDAASRALWDGPWAALTATRRGELLHRLGDLLVERAGEFAEIETRDTGKIIRETAGQAAYMAGFYHYYGGLADKLEGSTLPIDKPDMMALTVREPIGVVAGVVPWNSQIFLSATKLAPALAAGNTIVLKASEEAPAPLLKFAELVHEAGLPPGVVNIVTGFGEPCGRRLTSHPDVARVAFTGGPETARHVVRNTAENFAHTTLELGGKSPIVVFDDADLESAANAIVAGIFAASGQSCVAGSRLIVQDGMHDALIERLIDKASRIRIGDPMAMETEMGPLCTAGQRDRIEATLAATVAKGGEILCGGGRPDEFDKGYYFQPTIVACPVAGLPSFDDELFGPVLSVRRFADEDEAVALANDTAYGLAGGIFTGHGARALRMARRIRSGIAWVNSYRVVSPMAPFGGYGNSGLGREAGAEAIRDYSRTKTIWLNMSDAPTGDPFVMR